MDFPIYSIVDIETTGGQRLGNKIIEIAILNYQNGKIIDAFETLVHPERFIPVSISQFTGITHEMVEDAPKFYQVAKQIVEMTKDSIFVAHNVYFDFNFIKAEFASLGYKFNRPRLCTVRLARKLIPGHQSYSLGNLCRDLGIEIKNRHRAMGDAQATVKLFEILSEKEPKLHTLTKEYEEKILFPPNISRVDYDQLPSNSGVYYFWGKDESLLYVGKSINIKKRVASHFRLDVNNPKDRKLKAAVHKITFEVLGNDLCSQLIECHQIKSLRPTFNRSMNRIRFRYGLKWVKDMRGYVEPVISTLHQSDEKVIRVASKRAARTKIARIYKQAFGIQTEVLFLHNQLDNFKTILGQDLFNQRIEEIVQKHQYQWKCFHIVQPGRTPGEKARIIVRNSKLSHIEYWSDECVKTYPLNEDADMKRILLAYLETAHSKNVFAEPLANDAME